MPGETNLSKLIAGMRPVLRPGIFVVSLLPDDHPVPAGIDPVMVFREAEGHTLILGEEAVREPPALRRRFDAG